MKNKIVLILNILIVVLCVAIVGVGAGAIVEYASMDDYEFELEDYIYYLQKGSYNDIAERSLKDPEITEEEEPYVAIGEYFQAASFYKAYVTAGDSEKADEARSRMEAAAEGMGLLAGERDKMDALLGINE